MHGDRRGAVRFALDQQMWSHALLIANSLDKELWQEVVREFAQHELAAKSDGLVLRVAYGLFAGSGATASLFISVVFIEPL